MATTCSTCTRRPVPFFSSIRLSLVLVQSWKYKAFARWISGLKSLAFDSIVMTNSSTTGALNGLTASGAFANLDTSIYVGECFTFDKCSKLWDNRCKSSRGPACSGLIRGCACRGACCGSNKRFSVEIDVTCNSTSHELISAGLKSLTLDPFEITESVRRSSIWSALSVDARLSESISIPSTSPQLCTTKWNRCSISI